VVALVAVAVFVFPRRPAPDTTPIPGSSATFVKPADWRTVSHQEVLDPNWAADQKTRYPGQAEFIDAWVRGVSSDAIAYSAVIQPAAEGAEPDGYVDAQVVPQTLAPEQLATVAAESVDRQPVPARPGTTAIGLTLPGGPTARLDWSFELISVGGYIVPVHVRSYWLSDGPSLVVIQLTTFGDGHATAIADFDAAATTLRWKSSTSSAAP